MHAPRIPPFVRRTPGLSRAMAFLQQLLPGNRRPSLRELARQADVSYVTMWKAVSSAKSQALKSTMPVPDPDPKIGPTTRERVASCLKKEILLGRIAAGSPMPSIKELRGRFGVANRTISRAIADLYRDGLVDIVGKSYCAAMPSARRAFVRIGFLAYSWYSGPLTLYPFEQELLRTIESACSRARVELTIIRYNTHGEYADQSDRAPVDRIAHGALDGLVLPIWSRNCLEGGVLDVCMRSGLPLVAIDTAGGWNFPPLRRGKRWLHLQPTIPQGAGRQVGRILISKGHRRVAYISPFHRDPWSIQLLNGLTAAFDEAVLPEGIVECTHAGSNENSDYYTNNRRRFPMDALLKTLDTWKRHSDPVHSDHIITWAPKEFIEQFWIAAMRRVCDDLYRKSAASSGVTCWACANGQVAGFAADWIDTHMPKPALRPYLISFNGSIDSALRRITTYDADMYALGKVTLDFLLNRQSFADYAPARSGIVEIPGCIVERGSRFALSP